MAEHVHIHFGKKFLPDGSPAGEGAWAEPVAPKGRHQLVKLANTLFFATGFALGDVLEVDADGEVLELAGDSGKRCARFIMALGMPLEWLSDIVRGEFGLGRDETAGEGGFGSYYALTYPATKQTDAVALFDRLVEKGIAQAWEQAK